MAVTRSLNERISHFNPENFRTQMEWRTLESVFAGDAGKKHRTLEDKAGESADSQATPYLTIFFVSSPSARTRARDGVYGR